jgi:hypothetical protein
VRLFSLLEVTLRGPQTPHIDIFRKRVAFAFPEKAPAEAAIFGDTTRFFSLTIERSESLDRLYSLSLVQHAPERNGERAIKAGLLNTGRPHLGLRNARNKIFALEFLQNGWFDDRPSRRNLAADDNDFRSETMSQPFDPSPDSRCGLRQRTARTLVA